ncbi:hypothetical protein I79_015151 [Cricetulus griseus]|uniref:Uncharacterized protein n=1 Tax=Cricetulus griseus TaxID=10029 RepID=G3HW04_CRIGR|nr:hypothetical protein I79_015151 [Cricetulus griseus]
MEAHRLKYSLNSEPFQAQETMPHSADLRVHLYIILKTPLLHFFVVNHCEGNHS